MRKGNCVKTTGSRVKAMRYFSVMTLLCLFFVQSVNAEVLFLHHFDRQLDADHSQFGESKATEKGLGLSKEGLGYPYKIGIDKALDAGYSGKPAKDAMVLFPSANLDPRQGTIEMWVKSKWAPTPTASHHNPEFRTFLSVPLNDGHNGFI
ncbi:hypothetical protein KA005_54105, partial [bacterium]|nr:hypothetical protein [bacterium]